MALPDNQYSGNGARNILNRSPGFTVVELVMVIILLGILSVTAISRFVGPDAFAPSTVAQQIIAQTRFAQQTASARQDANISLTIEQIANDWRFNVVSDVDGVLRTERVDRANTLLQAVSGTVNQPVNTSQALQFSFDAIGDLTGVTVGAATGNPSAGVWVQVSGDSQRSVCVYPNGYAANGICG